MELEEVQTLRFGRVVLFLVRSVHALMRRHMVGVDITTPCVHAISALLLQLQSAPRAVVLVLWQLPVVIYVSTTLVLRPLCCLVGVSGWLPWQQACWLHKLVWGLQGFNCQLLGASSVCRCSS